MGGFAARKALKIVENVEKGESLRPNLMVLQNSAFSTSVLTAAVLFFFTFHSSFNSITRDSWPQKNLLA